MIGDFHSCALGHPVLCQSCEDDLVSRLKQSESDAMTLALRLYAEPDESLSPEARAVMSRWKPKLDALLDAKLS